MTFAETFLYRPIIYPIVSLIGLIDFFLSFTVKKSEIPSDAVLTRPVDETNPNSPFR